MAKYQLTHDPDVLFSLDSGACIPRGNDLWPSEWLLTNTPEPMPPPFEPNTPAHYRAIRDRVWEWMLEYVQDRRYDSIETCCSYYNSGVARYRAEARAMVAWRDAVNTALEVLVANPPPGLATWEQVRVLLPQPEAFDWPAEVELPLDTGEGPVQLPAP